MLLANVCAVVVALGVYDEIRQRSNNSSSGQIVVQLYV